jgi:hypothetical protein
VPEGRGDPKEYERRVVGFFDRTLAAGSPAPD